MRLSSVFSQVEKIKNMTEIIIFLWNNLVHLWIFSYIGQKYDRVGKTGFCLNFSFKQSCQKDSSLKYYLKSIDINIFRKNSVELAAYYRILLCIKFDALDKKINFDFHFS